MNTLRLLFLLTLVAVPLAAQDPGAPQAAEVHQRVMTVGPEGRRFFDVFTTRRGRLGITVNTVAPETDTLGALIDAVTPGSPAARAGLRTGDIVTSVDGQAVVQLQRGAPTPAVVLIDQIVRHSAGDTVRLSYRRGRDRKTVNVVLEEMPEVGMAPLLNGAWQSQDPTPAGDFYNNEPAMLPRSPLPLKVGPADSFIIFRSRMVDLQLAPMNQDLGQYFGVAEGVLVIESPRSSSLNLRGGDVILSVDGRRMNDPGQFFRVIGSYQSGEKFKINIMRNKHRETVTASVGE